MINDYQILGIEQTDDVDIIKAAYRKRAKEVHPDNTSDENKLKNHLLFIQINQAYKRLLGDSKEKTVLKSIKAQHGGIEGIEVHKDPAFVYYKMGMDLFMKIHPSKWNRERTVLPSKTIDNNKYESKEQQRIVKDLLGLFPKAYYYFSLVVHDYSESPWKADAEEKMKKIEERTKQYINIIKSFESYDTINKEKMDKLNEIIARTKEISKKEGNAKW